jgi:probable HAF family extracellular repeat protein
MAALALTACADPATGPSRSAPLAARASADVSVTVTDLGVRGDARAIAPNGRIAGTAVSNFSNPRAAVWQDGVLTDLNALLPGVPVQSYASDVSPSGTVVGWRVDLDPTTGGAPAVAVVWERGGPRVLPSSGVYTEATGINAAGDIIGTSLLAGGGSRALLWRKDAVLDLGTVGGLWNSANGINARGQVVGCSGTAGGATHAFLWDRGVLTDLGTLPGHTSSCATAINARGQVVGWSEGAGSMRPFLWDRGVMTDLGTLGGSYYNQAWAINDRGQVVGQSRTAGASVFDFEDHAFLWENGVMIDLGTLGGTRSVARGISDSGQIVGYADAGDGDWPHWVIWTVGRGR